MSDGFHEDFEDETFPVELGEEFYDFEFDDEFDGEFGVDLDALDLINDQQLVLQELEKGIKGIDPFDDPYDYHSIRPAQ